MQYIPFSREEANAALRRAVDGQAIFAAQYNAIVARTGMLRDELASSSVVRVAVPDALLSDATGVLVGWSDASNLDGDRLVAYSALGHALRRLRSGHRLVREDAREIVPVGASWAEKVALTGEPETALVSPTAVRPDARVELDPSAARDVLDAQAYAGAVLMGSSPSNDLSSRVAWTAREYATSSSRAEAIAYVALAGGTITALLLLGAFRRSDRRLAQPSLPGVVSSPYGDPFARPAYG